MAKAGETYVHSYIAENKPLSSLSVYNVGSQKCNPGFQWGPGVRDHYLIHHVMSGEGDFETKGKSYHLKKGDTFLIFPDTEACYRADDKNPWSYTWVGFAGTDAYNLLRHTDFSEDSPVLEQAAISEEIQKKILKVYEAKGNSFCNAVSMTGALYSMIAMLMENSTLETKQEDQKIIHVERAVRYIAEHYSYPITVEGIAAYTGVCRSHLYRMFQKVLKKSPKDFVDEYRILQACQLLKETNLPINTIAHSVGYEDNFYFSKAFKKEMGQTPTGYRKTHSSIKENRKEC